MVPLKPSRRTRFFECFELCLGNIGEIDKPIIIKIIMQSMLRWQATQTLIRLWFDRIARIVGH